MKIAFICVNYNNSKISIDYIKNVLAIRYNHDVAVIVVDNASQQHDVDALKTYIIELDNKQVLLLESKENLGYFKGLNLGVKHALKNGYNEFQIVGNNDIEFATDFIEQLQKINIRNNELVIAPDVITTNGIHENPHVVNRMSWLKKIIYDVYFFNYYVAKVMTLFRSTDRKQKKIIPNRQYIYMGIGAIYILTPHFFKYFDELWDYVFLYGEEAILAGQILSVGGKILYEPSLTCNHLESSSTSKMNSKYKYKVIQKSYRVYKKYL